jgi:predicted membrane-bound dolichyl-phosphate-mannose-protein mannosyltransferase
MMGGEQSLLDSFDGTGYPQEITYWEISMGVILGAVAAILGMGLLYTFLRLNLDPRAAAVVVAVVTLVWVFWPSTKANERTPEEREKP